LFTAQLNDRAPRSWQEQQLPMLLSTGDWSSKKGARKAPVCHLTRALKQDEQFGQQLLSPENPTAWIPTAAGIPGSPDPRIPGYWEPCVAHSPRHVRIQMEAVKWRRTPLLLLLRFVWLKQMAFWPAASLGCHISLAHRPRVPTKKPRSEG